MAYTSVMQRLYDSQINARIISFYGDGFLVQLGDEVGGFDSEAQVATWADVEKCLEQMARILYPHGVFARSERP